MVLLNREEVNHEGFRVLFRQDLRGGGGRY